MKSLLILRHAKSSWKHPELTDHDRPLSKRGKRDGRCGIWSCFSPIKYGRMRLLKELFTLQTRRIANVRI